MKYENTFTIWLSRTLKIIRKGVREIERLWEAVWVVEVQKNNYGKQSCRCLHYYPYTSSTFFFLLFCLFITIWVFMWHCAYASCRVRNFNFLFVLRSVIIIYTINPNWKSNTMRWTAHNNRKTWDLNNYYFNYIIIYSDWWIETVFLFLLFLLLLLYRKKKSKLKILINNEWIGKK